MTERINIVVGDDTREKLIALAGSERTMGEFISQMADRLYAEQQIDAGAMLERIEKLEQQSRAITRASVLWVKWLKCPTCHSKRVRFTPGSDYMPASLDCRDCGEHADTEGLVYDQ